MRQPFFIQIQNRSRKKGQKTGEDIWPNFVINAILEKKVIKCVELRSWKIRYNLNIILKILIEGGTLTPAAYTGLVTAV